VRLRSFSLAAVTFVVLSIAVTLAFAHAASTRPNGLDHRVDLLPAQMLLHSPATVLVDAERQTAALRLARWLLPGWFLSIVAQIVALAYVWQSGLAARLRDELTKRFGSATVVRFWFGAALALVARVTSLLPEFYIYRVQRTMGLSAQLFRVWTFDWVVNTVITMVATGVVIVLALWLVDRTRFWYVYLAAAIVVASLAIGTFSPAFSRVGAPPVRYAATIAAAQAAMHSDVPVAMVAHPNAHLGSAGVEGTWWWRRVVLNDTIFTVASPEELRFVVAYELAFAAMNAPLRFAVYDALFAIFGVAIAVAVADRIGFRRDDDPLSRIALVGALLGVIYMFVLPIDNAIQRTMSADATRVAVAATGARAGAVRATIRAADQRLEEVCPNVLTRLFFLTALDPSARVELANGVPNACP
jgi:Zn-dependent protease with chaperone function